VDSVSTVASAGSPAARSLATARRSGPADRTLELRPLSIAEILLLSREHGAVDVATGSPSFPAAGQDLVEAACAALRSGSNQYADPAGDRDLRVAAAAVHGADPDTEITVTAGATEGLNVVLQALVQPGDEVVVLEPFFEAYPAAIRLAGARPRFVRLRGPGWHWDPAELAAAFTAQTRAVIVNSPHNPTGRVLTAAEFGQLGGLCARWNVTLISDEVYAEFTERQDDVVFPWLMPDLADRVVVLRSLSKSHAVSGWRIGWVYAPPGLTRVFRLVHEVFNVGCAAPLQAAAAAVLRRRPGWSELERGQMAAKRRQVSSALDAAGLHCAILGGSAFLLPRLPDTTGDSASVIARRLAVEYGVAAAPGDLFFSQPAVGSRFLRFACNKSDEVLETAGQRLADCGPLLRGAR
jgi:N-succinyldiaminopimelate aminotransferase